MSEALSELTDYMHKTREDWVRREIEIEKFPRLVSNAGIVAGSPTAILYAYGLKNRNVPDLFQASA